MIRHKDTKNFSEVLKQEEQALNKQRNALKPEVSDLSSMYDKIPTTLLPEAVSFDLPMFIERYE